MNRKQWKRNKKRLRREARTPIPEHFRQPVSPDKLCFYLELRQAAASHKMPMESPASKPIHIEMESGEVQTITFADLPMTRGMMAVLQHVRSYDQTESGFATASSIMMRLTALDKVLVHPLAEPWLYDESVKTQQAIVHAAAIADMPSGHFEPKSFFRLVAEIRKEKYSGENEDRQG